MNLTLFGHKIFLPKIFVNLKHGDYIYFVTVNNAARIIDECVHAEVDFVQQSPGNYCIFFADKCSGWLGDTTAIDITGAEHNSRFEQSRNGITYILTTSYAELELICANCGYDLPKQISTYKLK